MMRIPIAFKELVALFGMRVTVLIPPAITTIPII